VVAGAAGAPLADEDDDRGEQRPEGQRALGAQGERGVEDRAVRTGREVLVIAGQADLLAQPQHDERARDRAEDEPGGDGGPGAPGSGGDAEPVADQAGYQPGDDADPAEPGVGDDERGRLRVDQLGGPAADLL